MAQGFSSFLLILYVFFLLQCNGGNCNDGDQKQVVAGGPGGNHNNKASNIDENHSHDHHHHPMSNNMDHMDIAATVGFFTTDDLYVGKRMTIKFANYDPSSLPSFLPKEKADRIPFSLKELPQILQLFSISHASPQGQAIEDTLKHCEFKPVEGERKLCPTSLESMLDFVSSILGKDVDFRSVRTTHLGKPSTTFQNYTFLQLHEVSSPNMVACHSRSYPYAVYYCHAQNNNKVFQILLAGEDDGDSVNGVAVCHMDTSHWSTDHISFRFLGVEPGSVPVCHFFARPIDIVWVQTNM